MAGENKTVFGPETEFEGEISFTDTLVIAGSFKGTINATGDAQVAKGATVDADKIAVQSIVIYGDVKGDIEATERVEICSGSKVSGDIQTPRLRIAKDVEYSGQVTMLKTEPERDIFSVASEEYRSALQVAS